MLGLYIHIPFCVKKCAYCDFVSFTEGDKEAYIDALICEIEQWRGTWVDSIFIGGGTPTILTAAQLGRLCDSVNEIFNISTGCEWTVEANPKTLDGAKLQILRRGGINRISIGVQSFNDAELRKIGRIHTADEAEQTIRACRKAGFDNINIDLMSALPGQTRKSFEKTLDRAISQNVEHISCYSLILEEGTPLYCEHMNTPLNLPDEDAEREMYAIAQQKLSAAGFVQYEISNFAKNNRECRHNLKYWHCDEYIGAGLAAHSYLNGERYYNTSDMAKYLSGDRIEGREKSDQSDKRGEFIIMALRLREGINTEEFNRRFGGDFDREYKTVTDKFIRLGLMEKTDRGFRLTNEGISLSNSVMCEFL